MNKAILLFVAISLTILNIAIFNEASEVAAYTHTSVYSAEMNDYSWDVVAATNSYRESTGKSVLLPDSRLARAAQNKADSMCKDNYFSHDLPDGTKWTKFITDTSLNYLNAGENLGKGYSSTTILQAWIDSPKHKENLDRNYTHIGVGYSQCNGKLYSVQEFATLVQ